MYKVCHCCNCIVLVRFVRYYDTNWGVYWACWQGRGRTHRPDDEDDVGDAAGAAPVDGDATRETTKIMDGDAGETT